MNAPRSGRCDSWAAIARGWIFGPVAVAIACSGCPRETAESLPHPLAAADEAVRVEGDSADVATWTSRRDEAMRALGSDDPTSTAALLRAVTASRNVALGLADTKARAAELERGSKWARQAVLRAPGDLDASYLLARLILDQVRARTASPESLQEARTLLVSVVSRSPAHASGAALAALGELYAVAGAGRDDGLELERAAGYFEGALDENRAFLRAHLDYAELVLMPWRDSASATDHLRACRDFRLDPSAATFVDDDRAQRRCARLLAPAAAAPTAR